MKPPIIDGILEVIEDELESIEPSSFETEDLLNYLDFTLDDFDPNEIKEYIIKHYNLEEVISWFEER